MKEIDIKRGHFKNIEGEKLKTLIEETFGKVETDNNKYITHYGALQPLTTWIKGKDALCVETKMKQDIDEEMINETIKRYNHFLEAATGYTAKERVKRSKKKAQS